MSAVLIDKPVATARESAAAWTLSVVIPAYNEEGAIAAILKRVLAALPALQEAGVQKTEVIVVDDGSKDRTAQVVRDFPAVRLLQHPRNRGYGAALKTGFSAATGNLLAFLDADGTYPPEYLPALCQSAMRGSDLVIGSRLAGERSQMPAMRRLGNLFFATMLSLVGRQRVSDSASGMRVFRRTAIDQIYPLPDGLNFTPVMSTRAIHENLKVTEVPIPYSERVGDSKLSVVRDGMRFMNSIVWTALSYNPVRILGFLGAIGVGIALVVGVALVILRLNGVEQLGAWGVFAVFTALVFGVTGVSVFNLGAMFNYLVALLQQHPVRQGMFGRPIFDPPLDRHFWWLGGLAGIVGLLAGAVSLAMSFGGWDMSRLWLWLLGSAMVILIGVQLVISWLVMRVLEELSQRGQKTELDLRGGA